MSELTMGSPMSIGSSTSIYSPTGEESLIEVDLLVMDIKVILEQKTSRKLCCLNCPIQFNPTKKSTY